MVEVSVLCPEMPATVRRLFLPVWCVRMLTSLGARLDEGEKKKKERGRITNHLGIKLRVSTIWWDTEANWLSRTWLFIFLYVLILHSFFLASCSLSFFFQVQLLNCVLLGWEEVEKKKQFQSKYACIPDWQLTCQIVHRLATICLLVLSP